MDFCISCVLLVSLDLDFLLSAKFVAFLWLRSSGRYFISIFFRCSAPPGSRFSWFAGASGACEPGVSFFLVRVPRRFSRLGFDLCTRYLVAGPSSLSRTGVRIRFCSSIRFPLWIDFAT
jgi:hypothetical protein